MSISPPSLPLDLDSIRDERALTTTFEILALVEQAFGTEFTILDGVTGETLTLAERQPSRDWEERAEVCREVARRRQPEFIDEEEPLAVLAIPLFHAYDAAYVAVGLFVTRSVGTQDLSIVSRRLGLSPAEVAAWVPAQTTWTFQGLERMANQVVSQWTARQRICELEAETRSLSDQLANTFEEIGLLHRLIHNLKISKSDEELGRVALGWLSEVMPVESLAIQCLAPADEGDAAVSAARTAPLSLSTGRALLTSAELAHLIGRFADHPMHQPAVFNPPLTQGSDWPFPQIKQLIAVPMAEGEKVFGWLLAMNHVRNRPFGSFDASLLGSVGAILGIHSGNIDLYRQQSQLLAGVVRALTSAIDAKDPYTCGHSDRVANVAVRLAQELGGDPRSLRTIYLSGLLHDIGKIGINDAVLRKPGRLSQAEYEHIKQHVQIGQRILLDIKELDDVLPIVLHHHEAWDGMGYPDRLAAEQIPLSARILSVADAYDAMGSDRPYRNGLPDEEIDEVFRSGAGKQWDPDVVAAFFHARADLREIVRRGHGSNPADAMFPL